MFFNGHVGRCGEADAIEINADMLAKIILREIPLHEVFLYLADHVFDDCEALTILWETLVVELPTTDQQAFIERLESLPESILDCPIDVRYHNGPFPNTERRRRIVQP